MKNQGIGFLIQARMGSSRLPGKVLMEIQGKPLLRHIFDRLEEVSFNIPIIVITSVNPIDDIIVDFCNNESIIVFRGSEFDVLDRFYKAAITYNLIHIVRLTGDNPLLDSKNLKHLLIDHYSQNADYSSNKSEIGSNLPIGVGSEIFTFSALQRSWIEGKKPNHREHVNEFILENPTKFKTLLTSGLKKYSTKCKTLRLTVDTKDDYLFILKIVSLIESHNLPINLNSICYLSEQGLIV